MFILHSLHFTNTEKALGRLDGWRSEIVCVCSNRRNSDYLAEWPNSKYPNNVGGRRLVWIPDGMVDSDDRSSTILSLDS